MKFKLLLLLLLLPATLAVYEQGNLDLLAVSKTGDTFTGSVATLDLKITPGSGQIFIQSFPLTQLDTQVSTRFANDIACSFTSVDCNNYNFFYTIRSSSSIVGGPSAGAAISLLTLSLLNEDKLDKTIAMTGTINSGGLIGPVSGVLEKAQAAEKKGLKKVLIPIGTSIIKENNKTYSVQNKTNITIIEVSNLVEAYKYFTGITLFKNKPLVIPENYQKIMKQISTNLCKYSSELQVKLSESNFSDTNNSYYTNYINTTLKIPLAFDNKDYYSAASYCFSNNIRLRYLLNLNTTITQNKTNSLLKEIKDYETKIDNKKLATMTDLQTYLIVKQRLYESIDTLNKINLSNNSSRYDYSYSLERFYSAKTWSNFFGQPGTKLNLDKKYLEEACANKYDEANQRYYYLTQIYGFKNPGTNNLIERTKKFQQQKDYLDCLFTASKVKAEADLFFSLFGVTKEQLPIVLESKLNLIEQNIARSSSFPILGYSYLQYSRSLTNTSPNQAILYSGYALELSDLDIYFKPKYKFSDFKKEINYPILLSFLLGLIFGISISIIYSKLCKRRKYQIFKK